MKSSIHHITILIERDTTVYYHKLYYIEDKNAGAVLERDSHGNRQGSMTSDTRKTTGEFGKDQLTVV